MDFETVTYEAADAIAVISLDRPDTANAQSMQLIEELDSAFDLAGGDDDVRVVILRANGKHFSAGHDLKELVVDGESDELRRIRSTPEGKYRHEKQMYLDKCRRIYEFPKPTIAAVQGSCVAAGLMLACMCDLIVAADDASFQNPVLRMSGAAVELLVEPWELGMRKAKEFLFTGEAIDAHEAWRLGMVNKVVTPERLDEATREMAQKICLVPPITAQMVKQSINQTFEYMGKSHSWNYHFMAHHFTHSTATAASALAEREKKGSMKEVIADRDKGDTSPRS